MVKKERSEWAEEEELRGVIIADSFDQHFRPITYDRPRGLLPLVNRPLIEYTLEFLSAAGINEILVCCCVHSDKFRAYLKQSRWHSKSSSTHVRVIDLPQALSTGDVLRDLFNAGALRSDFVLVTSDLVANIKLDEAVQQHRERARVDKRNMMTAVMRERHPMQLNRSKDSALLVAVDKQSGALVEYHPEGWLSANGRTFSLDLFQSSKQIEIRADLVDCHVYICSTQVVTLFSDNFDYQHIPNFIRGVLDDDVRGDKVHCYVIGSDYASRVTSPWDYGAVSTEIMQRWTFPIVPDSNLFGPTNYRMNRGNIYQDTGVVVARTGQLQSNVVVGRGTTIGENSIVSGSVIGKDCVIGEDCNISGCYIWDNVTVGNGCRLRKAIICDRSVIGQNSVVPAGSIVGFDVVIGADQHLPKHAKVWIGTANNDEFCDTEFSEAGEWDEAVVGAEGRGRVWLPDSDQSDIEDMTDAPPASLLDDESESDTSLDSDEDEVEGQGWGDQPELGFYSEVQDSIRRALAENVETENVVLEINSSKHAYNVTPREVIECVVESLLDLSGSPDPKALPTQLTKTLRQAAELLSNYAKTESDQLVVIETLEDYSRANEAYAKLLQRMLQVLYDEDVLQEEPIIGWFYSKDVTESQRQTRDLARKFVTWLEEAEEESDDE